jgi:hypothetical protein
VDWDSISAWVVNNDYNSPEIKTVIKEIVDRSGWASGNDIVIFWDDFEDRSTHASGCYRHAYSYDGGSTYAPKLHIEYTAGGATAKTAAETGSGADGSALLGTMAEGDSGGGCEGATSRGLATKDDGASADALTALIAVVLASETGSGVEQSALTSFAAKLSVETGSGVDIGSLVARLASGDTGLGVDAGMMFGLRSIFGGDGGSGRDALKALIEMSSTGSDMKLPGRLGQVRIPSKGVSL